ncbi:hypothetical protein Tco_0514197, partial [Tanacetum coccineum]
MKYPPKLLKPEDCYKKPKSSSICSDTQSEESDDANITVDPGWDDFCLTSAKLPRMEAHRLGKKTSLKYFPGETSLVSELIIKALWKAKSLNIQGWSRSGHDHKKLSPKTKVKVRFEKAREGHSFRKRELGKRQKERFTNEFVKTMSERFEKAIQDWYDRSQTANLEYLDLSGVSKIKLSDLTTKEGRRGSFKAYYRTREKGEKNRRSSAPNRALGKRSSKVSDYMSLVIAKSNLDYVEAKQATEEIEIPSIGFAVPSEFKEGTIKTLGAKNNKELEKQAATPQEFGEAIVDLTKRLEKQRKKMSQRRVPTLFSVREGTSTDDLPTQDDQVRDYQWTQRRRFELQRGFRRLRGQSYNNTLESLVNPEQQLAISGRRRAQLAPAEVFYQALRREGLQHIHIGLAMIRIHTLHRTGAGTNALVVLQDTRWTDTTRIISTMEVDLAQGTQLVYMVPDMMMSINDFHNHLRVSIQTHGYEAWQGGESNLLVTLSLIGRLSNTSYVGFNYNIENVVDHLSTRGISAIPGERRTMEELEGQSWHLRPVENVTARLPTGVAVHQRINRSTSLMFERYRNQTLARASVDQRDQEVMGDEEEILTAAVASVERKIPYQKSK